VDQARALIPNYAPQWTDHNPSDIGIALVELFAWLMEGTIYRLNRVPEKNYVAFLNLIGITREPAVAARAFLTFTPQVQINGPIVVPRGQLVQTQGTESEVPIVFETDEAASVLPINLTSILMGPFTNLQNDKLHYVDATAGFGAGMVSPAGRGAVLFGFDKATTEQIKIEARLDLPNQVPWVNPQGVQHVVGVTWCYSSNAAVPLTSWPALTVDDGTREFSQDGAVRFTVPNDWAAQSPSKWTTWADTTGAPVTGSYFWVCAILQDNQNAPAAIGFHSLLFNAVSAHNAVTIPAPETLGNGDGTPFQVFALKNRPLFAAQNATPYAHLQVRVVNPRRLGPGADPFDRGAVAVAPRDGGDLRPLDPLWAAVEDFPPGPGNYYRFNPATSEIYFGNYDPDTGLGGGTMPTAAQRVVAVTYRYVLDGAAGNVAARKLVSLARPVAGIDQVTNLETAFAGSDEEPIEDAKRRAPQQLKNRFRAVTIDDYEFLTRQASSNIAIARCLGPRADAQGAAWTFGRIDRSTGNVNVVIAPVAGADVARPKPGSDLLLFVKEYLDERRDLTAKLLVTAPRYLPVALTAEATVFQKAIDAERVTADGVKNDVTARAQAFLHPILGGPDGKGWQVGDSVSIADLYKVIALADDVGFISKLSVTAEMPDYHVPPTNVANERPFPIGVAGPRVQLADYELVCAGTMTITTVISS
jgi:hypothetical protein